jgi:hypothetical protein
MSKTVVTTGWTGPRGKCDMCDTKPATHWFGDTSVALCDSDECEEQNQRNWRRMLDEIDNDDY